MKHQKTLNLFNEASDSKFTRKKGNIVNNQSSGNYGAKNESIIIQKHLNLTFVITMMLIF